MREIEIDWTALHSAFQMNVPEVRSFFCRDDGRIYKAGHGDPLLAEYRGHPERFVPIGAIPSRIQYQWLDEFIQTVDDDALRERLRAAVNGKGAFRRFKDILLTVPDERRRWFEFRDHLMRSYLEAWVREQGVEPSNEPPWTANGREGLPLPDNRREHIEMLRDYLIAWMDEHAASAEVSPLVLEKLAEAVGERFRVKPKERSPY